MSQKNIIRVLVVDDHAQVRAGVAEILKDEADIQIVGEASDGREAIEKARTLTPDIAIMDIRMPNVDGLQATRIITHLPHPCKVVVLTHYEQPEYVKRAADSGATGFILKTSVTRDLVRAIRLVYSGERAFTLSS